ncbi:EpsG family protein [Flavobacterium fryxellicola]|nr:EpsG family protein [Flavobacterium fryxellicola]SHN69397.1 EpsG family protein [Flavobacterium fryxellicola]
MFDFIPLHYYTSIYYYFLLVVVFLMFTRSRSTDITSNKSINTNRYLGLFLLLVTIFYMGFRPISGVYFGDMATYANTFERYQTGGTSMFRKDVVFDFFLEVCSKIMSVQLFFLVCILFYVLPLWGACEKWFKEYAFYAFLALLISFSFWAYGTNGIRNGIATSIFLYALSKEKLHYKLALVLLAIGIHNSLIIPATALGLTYFYKNPKTYFYGWLLCIPLSLVSGGFWESLFAGFMSDDRASYLTDGNINDDAFSSTGFRWDFVLYSASAIYGASFFIFKKNFTDAKYNRLVSIYLTTNAFWILVIRANFSNRFAYLSWFLMAIIIVYPFLTKIQIKKQHKVLGIVLVAYFGFSFLMNVILA